MDWFRSQRWIWSLAALLGLVLQLGLSFGHVHGIAAEKPALVAVHDGAGTAPAGGSGDDDHDSHYCAIYALNTLLSGSQTAVTPCLSVPVLQTSTTFATEHGAVVVVARRGAFRSRAPPAA